MVVFVVAFAAYGSSLRNGFAYDDDSILTDNPRVTAPLTLGALFVEPYWKTREAGGLYRPLTILTYRWNHALHGLKPFGYHLGNVVLHGLVSVLVALLAAAWLGPAGALAAGLWFAVQPVHTEAVANVVGRAELLAALGVLLAAWVEPAGAAFRRGGAAVAAPSVPKGALAGARPPLPLLPARVVAPLGLAIGLFSKEVALGWLGVSLLRSLYRGRRPDPGVWGGYLVVTAAYFALRVAALGAVGHAKGVVIYRLDNVIATLPQPEALWTALGVFGRYVSLLVVPWRLSADYSWPMIDRAGWGEPWSWFGLIAAASGVVLALRGLRRAGVEMGPGAAVTMGLVLFGVTFAPVSNFVLHIGTVMGERLLYLPSAGVALIVGAGVERLLAARGGSLRVVVVAAGVLLVAAGGAHCWIRGRDWHDSLSIHRASVVTSPRSSRAHFNYSAQLILAGRVPEALSELRTAMSLDSTYTEAWVNLGNIQMSMGRPDEARRSLRKALETEPRWYSAHVSLGGVEIQTGNHRAALDPLERAIEIDATQPEAWFNLGLARLGVADTLGAVAALRRAVERNPKDADAVNNLAWYLATFPQFVSDRPEAVRLAEAAVALRADGGTLDTYSVALEATGRTGEAVEAARRALAAGAANRMEIEARIARLGGPGGAGR